MHTKIIPYAVVIVLGLTQIRLWSSIPLPYISPSLIVRRGIGLHNRDKTMTAT